MSLIVFLMVFNPILKLVQSLSYPGSHSDYLPRIHMASLKLGLPSILNGMKRTLMNQLGGTDVRLLPITLMVQLNSYTQIELQR